MCLYLQMNEVLIAPHYSLYIFMDYTYLRNTKVLLFYHFKRLNALVYYHMYLINSNQQIYHI
jgi:hypothetical protein